MSRKTTRLNETIQIHHGNDCAIGQFIDITDSRHATSGKDMQGEGYIVEWSEVFGFSQNKIGITKNQLASVDETIRLVNEYVSSILN